MIGCAQYLQPIIGDDVPIYCQKPDGKVKQGMKFGHLTAVELVVGSARRWLWLCGCGNRYEAYQTVVLRGKIVSCGCLKAKHRVVTPLKELRGSGRRIDLTGQKFNYLTATRPAGYAATGNILWEFTCDCGNKIIRLPVHIKNGDIKSCGCLRVNLIKQRLTLPNDEHIKTSSFKVHKKDALRRNYDSQLTLDQYLEITSKPCRYCGDFSIRKSKANPIGIKMNSVDRLNNESYYKVDNSVPACFECQQMKMQRTEECF